MKKRLFSLLLAALMLVGTFAVSIPVSAELNFNDTDGHWGEAAIEYVVNAGLMNGVGDGTSFAPNMSLTRGMVVTVLYRDNGSPKQEFK
ncbi:MAG: S-layer homology domain-containing protein, partial [Clostridia bacterium]|nr:S-layer homology domain-containing protein [Clostridia bacterium]